MHSATKKSAQKAPTFTRHRISSRSVRKNRAIKEPSDVTEKISDVKEISSSSSDDDGEKGGESIKRAPRPSTLNRPVSEAAVNSDAALANLRAAGGANGASLFRFLYQHHQVVVSLLSSGDRYASLRDRDERAFSYERVPTDAQKGRRKQENRGKRKKEDFKSLLFSFLVVDLYLLFCFFSMIFIK